MTYRSMRIASLVLIATALGGVQVLNATRTAEPMSMGCWDCWIDDCGTNEHMMGISTSSIAVERDGEPHLCLTSQCESHNNCQAPDELVEQLGPAIATRDIHRLEKLSNTFPEFVTYNDSRDAYQIRGCGGGLIASVPLHRPTSSRFRALVL